LHLVSLEDGQIDRPNRVAGWNKSERAKAVVLVFVCIGTVDKY